MLFLGAIGLIMACGLLGLWFAERARRRPQELRQCLTLLSLLDTEIVWGSTPLPEAFASLKERFAKPWHKFCAEMEGRLQHGDTAGSAWKMTISGQKANFCLKPQDWQVIMDVGKGLGRTDRQEQHKQLELMQKQLAIINEQAATWAEKQAKMWSYLGFLTGIAVVIFLI